MNRSQRNLIIAIVAVGLVVALLILFLPQGGTASTEDDHGEEAQEEEAFTRGPNGGRLLETTAGALEVTIYESGVEPELRVYPFRGNEPADPDALDLVAEIHRLGGVTDTLRLLPTGTFLRSDGPVYEPHSFRVVVRGTWGDEPAEVSYETVEGRVEMTEAVAAASGLVVEEAGAQTIATALTLPGEVQLNADRVARVAPRLSGSVVAIPVGLGQRVGAGAPLAVIESRELGQAKQAYVESLHRLELATAAYERERHLYERRISAAREYEQARHDLEEAELEKQAAEGALRAMGIPASQLAALGVEPEGRPEGPRDVRSPIQASLTRYTLRSPQAGEVIARSLTVGETVVGSEEAFVIADLSSVWVAVTVYARDINAVRAGQEVEVSVQDDSLGGPRGRGTVRYVGPVVGEGTRAAQALVVLPNPGGRWRPGMFVSARIVQEQVTVPVAVRREAVQTWRDMPVVFARFGEAFEVRPVTLGRSSGEYVEVAEGLAPGQPYAAQGAYLLKADLEKAGASHDH